MLLGCSTLIEGPLTKDLQAHRRLIAARPHSGSPFGLPAPYPPPGAFTRPLPDSWGLPDSYRSKNQLKITVFGLKSKKSPNFLSQ